MLRPGARLDVTDVVAEDRLSSADRALRGDHVGGIAGAPSVSEYADGLTAAGFSGSTITLTLSVADGMNPAIIEAVRPGPAGA